MPFGFLFVLLTVLPLYSTINENNRNGGPSENKDYPGQCWDAHDGYAYPKGTTLPIGSCIKVVCKDDFTYVVYGCLPSAYPSTPDIPYDMLYNWVYDLYKPYPECCPRLVEKGAPVEKTPVPENAIIQYRHWVYG